MEEMLTGNRMWKQRSAPFSKNKDPRGRGSYNAIEEGSWSWELSRGALGNRETQVMPCRIYRAKMMKLMTMAHLRS